MTATKRKAEALSAPTDPVFAVRQAKFATLCEAERMGNRATEDVALGIGTYKEKRLHALLKEFYCPEGGQLEVRLSEELLTGKHADLTDAATRRDRDRYVADILSADGREIIEIQTGGFYPLVKKLHFYLCATNCRVTLVHPLIAIKHLCWMDPTTGEVSTVHRSPHRGKPTDVAKELYWLLPYLAEQRLTLRLPMLEVEEIRLKNGWGNGGKRGSQRYDRFPMALCDEVVLSTPEDYAALFLPSADRLPAPFTAAEYAKAQGLRGKAVYAMLRMLTELGFLTVGAPRGRAGTWERCKERSI